MAKQSKKEVTVIARYQFKADPKKVAYLVRASNGKDTYQVFFFAGKACSCGCPAKKPCYHMTQLEAREAQRNQSSAREQALAAARTASEALVAQFDQEVQEQVEQELSAPVAPRSEMARLADLPLSEDEKRKIEQERKAARLASLNEEFPLGVSVPTFHSTGVLIEKGVIVESVAVNPENIDYVVVEGMESGERGSISCNDLRCLIRERADENVIDEEAKLQQWTSEELANAAPLNGNHRDGRIMPPPMSSAPTCRKMSVEWLCNRY